MISTECYHPIVAKHRSNLVRRSSNIALLVLAILGLARPAAALQRLEARYTPPSWKANPVVWVGDQNGNKIDDAIDSLQTWQRVDIVVNYNDCFNDSDLAALSTMASPGGVSYVSRFLSSVAVDSTTVGQVTMIAQDSKVAFIEQQGWFDPTLDVSVPDICATAGAVAGCAGNAAALGYDGTGVNIAIMDTGVDDAVHETFSVGAFLGGYDAMTGMIGNPDDTHGHGTHVASIALGRGGSLCAHGVAPGAGLYDVRCIPGPWVTAADALETIYDQHQNGNWSIDVINASFGQRFANHDGTESFAQLVDLSESLGILFVAAVGNDGPSNVGISLPAAATRALAVAASDDGNVAARSDVLASFSSRGKRADDSDDDFRDEMKPEVTAPGVNIVAAAFNSSTAVVSLSGTSMAAPHVAGLAALIMEALPGINVASVRDLIISRAEDVAEDPSDPGRDPVWNRGWGWGLVNAYEAVTLLAATDLSFPNHPSDPGWLSPDISVNPAPQAGQLTTVKAVIENRGPGDAFGVVVHFGVHVYSASTPTFQAIGTRIVNIASGTSQAVSMGWTPAQSSHQCMQVEIGYGADTDFGNNRASRNLNVTASPVYFTLANTVSADPVMVHFETEFADSRDPQWAVTIQPDLFELAADDCPRQIEVNMIRPPGVAPGDSQTVHIRAMADTVEIGGVSVLDKVRFVSAVEDGAPPAAFTVESYPNPFNPQVEFAYFQPTRGRLTLEVFNLRGELVAVVCDEVVAAGSGTIAWSGTDTAGRAVPSGAYFYRARTVGASEVGKIMLVK